MADPLDPAAVEREAVQPDVWGLYDERELLRDIDMDKDELRRVWTLSGKRRIRPGWTFRLVNVTPKDRPDDR